MEDLIKKAKSGDKLAFTELMLQMQDELYKIAKIRLKNDDDVFDVIQDTMLSAYKSLSAIILSSSFAKTPINFLSSILKFTNFIILHSFPHLLAKIYIIHFLSKILQNHIPMYKLDLK